MEVASRQNVAGRAAEPAAASRGGLEQASFAWRLLPISLLLALTIYLGCFELADFDVWWHLRTGQLIGERGVPVTDWFSFTSAENAWIDVHWCFQWIIAKIHSVGGVKGLVAAKAVVGLLVMIVALSAYRRDWPIELQTLVWVPALLLMSSRLYVRPEIMTLLFTAVYLAVLFHAERRPGLLWVLPTVQIAWSNMHGLFVFGPVLIGMYFIEALLRIDRVSGLLRHLMPVTLLVAIACTVSPYGIGNVLLVPELWLKMSAEGRLYRDTIAELEPIDSFIRHGGIRNPYIWTLFGLMALAALSVLLAWRAVLLDRRVFRVLTLGAFGWLGLQATRNGNHFALVAGTVIGWNLADRPRRWRLPEWAGSSLSSLLILIAGWYCVSGRWYLVTDVDRRFGLGERAAFISHDGMRLAGAPGLPDRVAAFNFGHAAPFLFHNGPERKVFFDGRLELHNSELYQHYLNIEREFSRGSGWDAQLAAAGVDLLLIDSEYGHTSQAAVLSHRAWRCLYLDEAIGVFLRRSRPVPAAIVDWDARTALFAQSNRIFDLALPGRTSKPRWFLCPPDAVFRNRNDYAATRLLHLAMGLSVQPDADRVLYEAVLWQTVQKSLLGVYRRPSHSESFRNLGAALDLLGAVAAGDANPPRLSDPWDMTEGLVNAMAVVALEQALACDAHDVTANLVLAEIYFRMGALKTALRPLDELSNRKPTNRAQAKTFEALPRLLEQRRNALQTARKSAEAAIPQGDGTRDPHAVQKLAAEIGVLEDKLGWIDSSQIVGKSAAEIDRIGTWLLQLGRTSEAISVYNAAEMTNARGDQVREKISQTTIDLRLACCLVAIGDFAEAKRRFEKATAGSPNPHQTVEAWYGLAVLNLMDGSRDGFAAALASARVAGGTDAQNARLELLLRLLPER